jgi:uncharacterized protein Usg
MPSLIPTIRKRGGYHFMKPSVLTHNQKKVYGPKIYTESGQTYKIIATVRHDDECKNGHNTFSITGDIYYKKGDNIWVYDTSGCIHDDIAKRFPELAPFIKYHLMSTDEPMHYVANTLYHADEHGPTYAWVYYTGCQDPLKIADIKEKLLGYEKAHKAKQAEGQPGYRVVWDEKTAKTRNLDHARSTAVWPEATDEELTAPGLKERLEARLPQLMKEFQEAVESLGFVY